MDTGRGVGWYSWGRHGVGDGRVYVRGAGTGVDVSGGGMGVDGEGRKKGKGNCS